jgi:hypothetical protein
MENETLLRIIMPALTGSLFGGLAGVVVTFALSPAKDLRYALTQLYADIMYHHPVLHCRCGAGNYQAEARKDIRRAASQVFAAYVRVYFYDFLTVLCLVPERALIMHRDTSGNGDGIYDLAIGISNSIGIYPPEEGYNPESEAYLQADIQKICLLLSQTVESMWSKYGRKNVSG